MSYSVGDKVEWKSDHTGKLYKLYLMRIVTSREPHLKNDVIWEVRRARTSHLGLISESEIVRKISSNFEELLSKRTKQTRGYMKVIKGSCM